MKEDLKDLDPQLMKKLLQMAGYMSQETAQDDAIPNWYDEKNNRINEVEYCAWFIRQHPIRYVGGVFYDINGFMREEKLAKEIIETLKPYLKSGLVRKSNQIIDELKYEALCDSMPKHTDRVHFKNGTYFIEGGFIPEKEFCSNRLPIDYNPDAKEPGVWLSFLNDLLYEEDIVTLQEFMGYVFIPTTKAQSMLMLIGSGGEGKTRVGFVCRNLLGDNMNICSITKLSTCKFSPADQEGKLLMIDDDSKMEALADTGMLKAIVTMEDKMDLERKGKQSYQGYLNVRIMVFGNGALSSLYDKSEGFYRRQIVLKVKEKPDDRVDDRELSKKLSQETEGIALWCLEGLKRLSDNGFHFTISERTKLNQQEMRREEDSIMDFFESSGYIAFQEGAKCTTKDLYDAYRQWGEDNLVKIRSENSFSKEVRARAAKLGLTYFKNVSLNGKTARGYMGVYSVQKLEGCPFKQMRLDV